MLRFRAVTASASPTLTFFHSSNSKLSHHLLGRLAKHDLRYLLDVRLDKLPLYGTYHFIHEECMNVHPQNTRLFERIFPALLASPGHLFCDVAVKKHAKQKQFVPDLDVLSEDAYLDKVAHHAALELSPFVVDWANRLVAVDDDGMDRIMQNYYSCGIQSSRMQHEALGSDRLREDAPVLRPVACNSNSFALKRTRAASVMCAVHPHVAEFADLF